MHPWATLCFILVLLCAGNANTSAAERPNIIFILTDDLGFGDVGVFFQNARRSVNSRSEPWHMTPQIDQLAAEGTQLRDHYCPAPVCAPSRASLLLGVHQGHANVRDNQFDKALENNHTLATVMKGAGYATACIGKWGLQGKRDDSLPNHWPAHPLNRGFDYYFGYISHNAGHWHYPKEDGQILLDGAVDVSTNFDRCYTTDLFTARAKKWISDQQSSHPRQPFFLYLAYDTPHAKLQLPPGPFPAGAGTNGGVQWTGNPGSIINTASGTPDSYTHPDYASSTWDHDHDSQTPKIPWPDVYKRYATDVRRIDDCVGDLLQLLKDLRLDNNTLVVFTSDNGPSKESYLKENYSPEFFNSFGPYDGIKRDCWEGGIRVGALARWPAAIPAGQIRREPSQFHDWMPTFAQLAGVPAPARTDGVSLVPILTGKGQQMPSRVYVEYFQNEKTPPYPEFAADHRGRVRRQMQALRIGDYIGVRYAITNQRAPFEIYDISRDPQQTNDFGKNKDYAALQRQFHQTSLWVRRPDPQAKRPYDRALVPAATVIGLTPGLQWRAHTDHFTWLPKYDDMPSSSFGVAHNFQEMNVADATGFFISGDLMIPADSDYTFWLPRGAGVLLRLHEATVIDGDLGETNAVELSGAMHLQKGPHPFRLYVRNQSPGQKPPTILWSSDQIEKQPLPPSALFHEIAGTSRNLNNQDH